MAGSVFSFADVGEANVVDGLVRPGERQWLQHGLSLEHTHWQSASAAAATPAAIPPAAAGMSPRTTSSNGDSPKPGENYRDALARNITAISSSPEPR